MGTSQSSAGPGSGVPMVPAWVSDPQNEFEPAEGETSPSDTIAPEKVPAETPSNPIAPSGRFRGARLALGEFARTGHGNDLRRGLKHYVQTGYGGSATAARRMSGTATTASALYVALSSLAARQAVSEGSLLDPTLLSGRSAREVMDAIVEAVKPVDGAQDSEAARAAINDALSELLTRFPEADLLNLDVDQQIFAIERYTASDAFRRFDLDVGKAIRDNAPSAATGLSRLKQVRDYVKETVAASFRRIREAGRAISASQIGRVVHAALHETFQVFEGYAE